MTSPGSIPLRAEDGTYSTPSEAASHTDALTSATAAASHSDSAPASSTTPFPPSSTLMAPTPSPAASSPLSPSSSSPAAPSTASNPSPAPAPAADTAPVESPAAGPTAEEKMDTVDEDYVMVDRPPDTEAGPTEGAKPVQGETKEGEGGEGGEGSSETPQKKKRRTELELATPVPVSSVSRSGRQRKAPAVFTPTAPPEKKLEYELGAGTALGQIPNVTARLEKTKTSAPELRRLYSLCFPLLRGLPTKLKIKPLLRSFSGLTRDEQRVSARGKMRRMLKEEKMQVIGRLLLMMDLDYQVGKEHEKETVDAVMQWLERPTATGRELQSIPSIFTDKKKGSGTKKRKRSQTSSKKKKSGSGSSGSDSGSSGSDSGSDDSSGSRKLSKGSAGGKKGKKRGEGKGSSLRTANSFVVFSSAKRDEVREMYPDISVQEVTSRLSIMWRELMAEEKEVYELAAKRLREDAARDEKEEKKRQSAKRKKKTTARSPQKKKDSTASPKKRKKPSKPAESGSSDSGSGSDSGSSSGSGSDSGTEDEDDGMGQSTDNATTAPSSAAPTPKAVKTESMAVNGSAAVKVEHNGGAGVKVEHREGGS